MRGYQVRALSEYEGFKRLDQRLEAIALGSSKIGKYPKPLLQNRPQQQDFLCERCKLRKRTCKLVRVRSRLMMGSRIPGMHGRYLRVCFECADLLEHQRSIQPDARELAAADAPSPLLVLP